jgi:hypothetical protein
MLPTLATPLIISDSQELRGVLVDGQGEQHERIAVHASDVLFVNCFFRNCPFAAVRLWGIASNITFRGCLFVGCQALNTRDDWTGRNVLFDGCRVLGIPTKVTGALIDQPAVTVAYTGVRFTNTVFECLPGAHRCLSLARCVNASVEGCTFLGAAGVEDLLHFEDKAELLSIQGNTFDLLGAANGIDGSLGMPDSGYPQDDHDSREVLIAGNALRCAGGAGIHIQGKAPHVCDRLTILANTISDASVGIEAKVGLRKIDRNALYGCKVDQKLFGKDGRLIAA